MGKVYLNGIITIPEAEQAAMRPLLDEHVRLTRAEPGCIAFDATQSAADPTQFEVAEIFRDEAAFAAHQARIKTAEWGAKSGHLVRNFTKRVDP